MERPKPCGAWPRSVVLPCAAQVRVPFVARCGALPTDALVEARPLIAALAEGGLLLASSRCRADMAELLLETVPRRLAAAGALGAVPRALTEPLAGRFAALFAPRFELPFACEFPVRPADNPVVFIVWTGEWEAAAAGAVRAMTARFCTDEGGVEMWPRVFAAPKELCLVGDTPTLLVNCAPFKDAAVTCVAPRLMAWPFTKALREATVTALGLCALTKLTL